MEQAGHRCAGSCEINKYAREIYSRHYEESEYSDIREVDARGLPDFDVLCAGFPCQAFSFAGRRRGFEDDRGNLFFEIARVAKEKHPQTLLLENVRGLLNHKTFLSLNTIHEIILSDLADWKSLKQEFLMRQKQSLLRNIIEVYLQEILLKDSVLKNKELDTLLHIIWDFLTVNKENSPEIGWIGNYRSLPTLMKQTMKNGNSYPTGQDMLLVSKLNEWDIALEKLFSTDSLSVKDITTLEKAMDMSEEVEILWKKFLITNLKEDRLFIMLMGTRLTTSQKTCLFAIQSLNIWLFIVKCLLSSEFFLTEEILCLTEKKGNTNWHVKTFGIIIDYLSQLGYDVEWQVIDGKYFVPQSRERVFIVGHSRDRPFRKIFPIGEGYKVGAGAQQKAQGEGGTGSVTTYQNN